MGRSPGASRSEKRSKELSAAQEAGRETAATARSGSRHGFSPDDAGSVTARARTSGDSDREDAKRLRQRYEAFHLNEPWGCARWSLGFFASGDAGQFLRGDA